MLPLLAGGQTTRYSYDHMERLTRIQYGDGSTVDYVYDNLGNRLIKSTTLGGPPSNTPPSAVSNPNIANGGTNIAITPSLSWSAAFDSDAVAYYVYFGTTPAPPLVSSGWGTNFSPGHLQCFTTYYWYVVARDSHNAQTIGPLWSFTTGPDSPIADFSASILSGNPPLTVNFVDQSRSACGSGAPVSWRWDFDNTGVIGSTNQNPTNIYMLVGDHSVKLTVLDQYGDVGTIIKTNFISVLGSNIVDLAPQSLTIQSAAGFQNLLVNYSIANLGTNALAGKWPYADNFYLSPDPFYDPLTATFVASFSEYQSLPVGYFYNRVHLVPIPSGLPLDQYFLILYTDGNNDIAEINEDNNTMVIPLQGNLPDLVPGSLVLPGPAVSGHFVDVIYSATNAGSLTIGSLGPVFWEDSIYLSTNSVPYPWDTPIGSALQDLTLLPGQSYTTTNLVFLPDSPPGSYYLILSLNDPYGIVEDTSNDILAIPITLQPPPLRPISLTAPASGTAGQPIQVVYAVTNAGGTSVTGDWLDMVWLSTNSVWNRFEATNIAFLPISGPIPAGGTYAQTNSIVLPRELSGSYYLIIQVAGDQSLGQTDVNGTLAVPIYIRPLAGYPNLAPVSLISPASAAPGQRVQVAYVITNSGPVAAAGSWYDAVLLSTNLPGTNGTLVGINAINGPLASGASYTRTNFSIIPTNAAGAYYLVVQADAFNQVYEPVKTNTTLAAPLSILMPRLYISYSTNTVTLYWQDIVGWSLQQNSNLASAAGWFATSGVVTSNGTNHLNLANPNGNLFYRLKSP